MKQALPYTVGSLVADFRGLGLAAGDIALVHTSMRALGFVAGGVQAVVQALLQVLNAENGADGTLAGTLVVPTHTPSNTDPAGWANPPVPEAWWPTVRQQSPGFDPARTPSQWMGILPETVRAWPGALRSTHPEVSFAAIGGRAAAIVGDHPLHDGFGDCSPLGAVYREHGKVVLLGCGHQSNTSLHLAECRQPSPAQEDHGSAVRDPDGTRRWVTWTAAATDVTDFAELGADYEAVGPVSVGTVGGGPAHVMPQRDLVDFATRWLNEHRR